MSTKAKWNKLKRFDWITALFVYSTPPPGKQTLFWHQQIQIQFFSAHERTVLNSTSKPFFKIKFVLPNKKQPNLKNYSTATNWEKFKQISRIHTASKIWWIKSTKWFAPARRLIKNNYLTMELFQQEKWHSQLQKAIHFLHFFNYANCTKLLNQFYSCLIVRQEQERRNKK